jgi:hypothetical protein
MLCVLVCGLGVAGPVTGQGVHLGIVPLEAVVAPGDTFLVELRITEAGSEFNAFDVNLGFDPVRVAFVPTVPVSDQRGALMTDACANTFHVFTSEAAQLRITMSLLCASTFVMGPGVIYQVKFRALEGAGEAAFICNTGTQFYRAGYFVNPLVCQPGSVTVDDGTLGLSDIEDSARSGVLLGPPVPNPSRGWGVLSFTLPRAEAARLEIYDAAGRLVAQRPDRNYGAAGRYVEGWDAGTLPSGVYLVRLVTASGLVARTRWTLVR